MSAIFSTQKKDKQWKMVLIKNGNKYDKDWMNVPILQKSCAKRGLSKEPFKNLHYNKICGIILISKGEFFDKQHEDIDWAHGSYLDFIEDSYLFPVPIPTTTGGQNGKQFTFYDWYRCIANNPLLIPKIKSWKIKYSQHLTELYWYNEIRIRVLHAPFGYMVCAGIKTCENRRHNRNWKIDDNDPTYCKRVSCQYCISKQKQCPNCEGIQQIITPKSKSFAK